MENPSDLAWVTLARLIKTQGRKGELAADLLTDIPNRFRGLRAVRLWQPDGRQLTVHLARFWPHQGRLVFAFDEIHDMDTARAWIGAEVQVPLGERAAAPPGEYFASDLEGCLVNDRGRPVGVVTAVEAVSGGAPLLHVRDSQNREILIPFAAPYIVAVNPGARRLDLQVPEGLLDLNL